MGGDVEIDLHRLQMDALHDEIRALRVNNQLLRSAIAEAQTKLHDVAEVLEEAYRRARG